MSLTALFNRFDSDKDKMLNQGEFQIGIQTICNVNQVTLEKMFNLMDAQGIGMVNLEQFMDFMTLDPIKTHLITHDILPEKAKEEKAKPDSFEWQYSVIKKMKQWFKTECIF